LRKAELGQRAVVASVWVPASAGTVRAKARTYTAAKKHVVRKAVAPVVVAANKPVVVAKPVVVVAKPVVVIAAKKAVTPKPQPVPVAPKTDARFGRGLLLMIAGLIALGMLSMVFSASGEEEPVQQQAEPAEPMRIFPKKTA